MPPRSLKLHQAGARGGIQCLQYPSSENQGPQHRATTARFDDGSMDYGNPECGDGPFLCARLGMLCSSTRIRESEWFGWLVWYFSGESL